MGFGAVAWRRMRPWIAMLAVCAMMMHGYYLAGDRESDAIIKGFLGTAMVGVPSLAALWILDWCVRGVEARWETRKGSSAHEGSEARRDLKQR
jgi:hypothetical protein